MRAMRFRSENNTVANPMWIRVTNCSGVTTETFYDQLVVAKNGTSRWIADVVIPGFERKSAQGQVFCNPMESMTETYTFATTASDFQLKSGKPCTSVKRNNQLFYYGNVVGVPALIRPKDDAIVQALHTEAITDALSRVEKPDATLLVELAELKRTITSISEIAEKFRGIIFRIRSSNAYRQWVAHELDVTTGRRTDADSAKWKKRLWYEYYHQFRHLSRYISEEWLRYRYTFVPLYLTARDVLDSLKPAPDTVRHTARAFKWHDDGVQTWSDLSAAVGFGIVDVNYSLTRKIEVRAGVLYERQEDTPYTKRVGLGWSDIPSAVYELIPFSFILDWFANVGDYIVAKTPQAGIKQLCSWTTETQVVHFAWQQTITANPAYTTNWNLSPGGAAGTIDVVYKRRVPNPSAGITLLNSTTNLRVWFLRLADVAALFRLLVAGKYPPMRA